MTAARSFVFENRSKARLFHEYLTTGGPRKTFLNVPKGEIIFRQADSADSIFYIQKGRVKVSVTSNHGKEATLALHGSGDFIGEECIASSHPLRVATAIAIVPCLLLRIDGKEMVLALDQDKLLAQTFQSFLLSRCMLMQADLIDHLFNSSEKRLARTLLLLSHLENGTEAAIQHATQETLAEMIGTTRSRVNFFMNRFRKMGYIDYKARGDGVKVHRSLFNVLLQG